MEKRDSVRGSEGGEKKEGQRKVREKDERGQRKEGHDTLAVSGNLCTHVRELRRCTLRQKGKLGKGLGKGK